MVAPKKTNGSVGYREVRELIDDATDRLARKIHEVGLKLDTAGIAQLEIRVKQVEVEVVEIQNQVRSLELSRAEGKGRAAVAGGIVAFVVSVILALITLGLNRLPSQRPSVYPTPTVIVTLAPQAAAEPGTRVTYIIEATRGTTATPEASPSASPTPTATPTTSPPPGPVCALARRVGIACRPVPASKAHAADGLFSLPLMLAFRLLRRR